MRRRRDDRRIRHDGPPPPGRHRVVPGSFVAQTGYAVHLVLCAAGDCGLTAEVGPCALGDAPIALREAGWSATGKSGPNTRWWCPLHRKDGSR